MAEQLCLNLEPSWMDPLVSYLKDGRLPKSDLEARELKRRAQKFILINEELYKRSFTQPLLRCVRPRKANYVLREIHEGICGSHIGARTLYQKAFRQGYYWLTMVSDAEQLVKKCERCQRVSNLIHVPSAMLTHLVQPCPFAQWGIDILDNRTQFTDRTVKEWCQELGIKQHFTSADERWVDELLSILWSYRTTRRGSTGETPFSLCYGSKALIPVEIGIPTFRVEHFDPKSNEQGLRNNLDTVEELRDEARVR
ncbi:uncharacterized protein LOC127799798 [Diospyros lotus]|uniref:uncharacterized protein LOC127799798 n=1 Tax=Diospyros lotus TaxID=55363 RepID=UPI00225A42BD|nr:uncharacterized protein LOC127799798 [Diospyros lotus]